MISCICFLLNSMKDIVDPSQSSFLSNIITHPHINVVPHNNRNNQKRKSADGENIPKKRCLTNDLKNTCFGRLEQELTKKDSPQLFSSLRSPSGYTPDESFSKKTVLKSRESSNKDSVFSVIIHESPFHETSERTILDRYSKVEKGPVIVHSRFNAQSGIGKSRLIHKNEKADEKVPAFLKNVTLDEQTVRIFNHVNLIKSDVLEGQKKQSKYEWGHLIADSIIKRIPNDSKDSFLQSDPKNLIIIPSLINSYMLIYEKLALIIADLYPQLSVSVACSAYHPQGEPSIAVYLRYKIIISFVRDEKLNLNCLLYSPVSENKKLQQIEFLINFDFFSFDFQNQKKPQLRELRLILNRLSDTLLSARVVNEFCEKENVNINEINEKILIFSKESPTILPGRTTYQENVEKLSQGLLDLLKKEVQYTDPDMFANDSPENQLFIKKMPHNKNTQI